jgi:hypothetical protein
MRQRKPSVPVKTKFSRELELSVDGFSIVQGEIIKIKGENGMKFKFHSLVTNDETGIQWIDCFEIERGVIGAQRSFRPDRIKRIPKKRVKKRVNRSTTN